jgi:hypothetical protein
VSSSSTSAPLAYTVNKAETHVSVESSAAPSVKIGSTVTFTAHLSPVAPGSGTSTGSVVFTASDGTSLNGGAAVTLVNGTAQVSGTLAQAGTPVITATYSGDANFKVANGTVTQSVTQAVGFLRYGDVTRGTIATQVSHPFESISAIVLDTTFSRLPGVTVTFSTPDSGPSATFSDSHTNVTTAVSDAQGLVRPAQFTANGLEGSYRLNVTVSGSQTASGNPITISFTLKNMLDDPNAETHIFLGLFGGQTTVLTPFKEHLGAQVFDGNGHNLSGATVVFSAPTSGASGTFPDGSTSYATTVDSNAVVSAPTLTANGIVGTYDVVITVIRGDGLSDSTSLPFTNVQVGTTTALEVAPAGGAALGQSIVLSASVRPVAGVLVPAAPVDFSRDGAPIDSCLSVAPLKGVATCTLNGLDIGGYTFGAMYAGDASSASSSAPPVAYSVHAPDPTLVPSVTFTPTATLTMTPTSTSTPTTVPPMVAPVVTQDPVLTTVIDVDPPVVLEASPTATPTSTPTPLHAPVVSGGGGGGGGGTTRRAAPAPMQGFGGGGGGGSGGGVANTPSALSLPPVASLTVDPPATDPSLDPVDDATPVAEPDGSDASAAIPYATLSIGLIQADALVPGQSAQLTFLLLNAGDIDASPDLLVQDILPAGVAFNSVLSEGWTCGSDVGQPLSCWLPAPMAAGSQTTLQLLVDVTTADASAPLVNKASLSSPSLDPSLPPPATVDMLAFQPQATTAAPSDPPQPEDATATNATPDGSQV